MKRTIEFQPSPAAIDPWKTITGPGYQDELLKPEYSNRQLRLKEGPNWLRLVPAVAGSSANWILGIHALATSRGRMSHPRTVRPKARSVWDDVYTYLAKASPDKLYSRNSRDGLKLLPNPLTMCWVLVKEHDTDDSPFVCRLLVLSGYSGVRGGSPGLGHQILSLANERDEAGEIIHPIAGSDAGVQICIEKIVSEESKFPRYVLRAGRTPAPIGGYMDRLAPGEEEALCPLENTIRLMSEDEQFERLAHLMPASELETIRKALAS